MKNSKLVIKGVKKINHGVFSVGEDGLKTIWDSEFNKYVPFGSGQQLKRSIIDSVLEYIGSERYGVEMRWKLNKKELKEDVAITSCNPEHVCQLLSGYLNTDSEDKLKRTSPLSVSAFMPIHPLLGGVNREIITFDRTDDNNSSAVLFDGDKRIEESDIESFLNEKGLEDKLNNIKKSKFIPDNKRANGLFSYSVELDLSRLFNVQCRTFNTEINKKNLERLVDEGWTLSECGNIITYPKEDQLLIIEALANAIIDWQFNTNQSRTYDNASVFAVSISDKAYEVNEAIRSELVDHNKAQLILDDSNGTLFTSSIANGFIMDIHDNNKTLTDAKNLIINKIKEYYVL